jgi:predicted HAD superfamily Cof-like phosphohydrolase
MKHVKEFHQAFGCPNPPHPSEPSPERLKLRLRLILEEVCELVDACGYSAEGNEFRLDVSIRDEPDFPFDMVKVVDALADIDYVVEGMRLELGVDGEPVAAEVHRSNMAKVGATQRADGKIMKPEGWKPPDIAGELRKQGWVKP